MYQDNNITNRAICQDPEAEILQSNTINAFKKHLTYRNKYQDLVRPTLNPNQLALWDTCSSDIWVRDDGTVAALNSCRNRFCAVCTWRAARRRYSYTIRAMRELESEGTYAYLFATMTLKNCKDWELPEYIDKLMTGINRMQSCRTWRNRVIGYIRQLEITYNNDKTSPSYDTYHPHFHYILCVPRSYFTDSTLYLDTYEWRQMWERSLRLDYTTQYKLEAIRAWDDQALIGQVCEISKYQLKLSSVVETGQAHPVQIIADAIKGRRMVAYGGIYREINQRLKQADKAAVSETVEGTHYHYSEEERDYVPTNTATFKREATERIPEWYLEGERLRKQIRRVVALSADEKRKALDTNAPHYKAQVQPPNPSREAMRKALDEVEGKLISLIDSEPSENDGQKYSAYRKEKAHYRRRYEKLRKAVTEM